MWIKPSPTLAPDLSLTKMTKLLILSAHDNPTHVSVVQALAHFLQMKKNMFSIILPCWYHRDIATRGWDDWFRDKLNWADKVVVIASDETQMMRNGMYKSQDGNFINALHYIAKQCQHHDVSHRYHLAYFEYSNIDSAIPQLLKHLPKYKLMKHLEALFFKLHGIEKYDVSGEERMAPWLTEDLYHTDSNEGARLHDTIQIMKNTCTNNNVYIENKSLYFNQQMPTSKNFMNPQMAGAHPVLRQPQGIYYSSCRTWRSRSLSSIVSLNSSCAFEEAFMEITGRNAHDVDVESVKRS